MGSIEKEIKRTVRKGEKQTKRTLSQGEKLAKEAAGAQMTLYGIQPGSSGIGGDIAEVGTMGHMESGKTKQLRAAEEEQQAILDEEKRQLEEEEEKRKQRILKGRQGKRSLLYAEGTEAGVSNTLGG